MMCIRCAAAQQEREAAQARILELTAQLAEVRHQLHEVTKLCELRGRDLERLKTGRQFDKNQPERVAPDPLQLAFLRLLEEVRDPELKRELKAVDAALAETGAATPAQEPQRRKRGGRRNLLDMPMPEIVERITPPEVLASGGVGWTMIDEEISSRVALRRSRYERITVIREKYVRTGGGPGEPRALITAPQPDWVHPGLMVDTSVISEIALSKFGYMLPLNRQETMTRYAGFELPRSSQCDWLMTGEALLEPITLAMHKDSIDESYCIATDATGAPVRVSGGRAFHSVFVFVGDTGHITFRHARHHTSESISRFLDGFRGYLLSDASSIYDALHAMGVVAVYCWVHLRRYFWRATLTEVELAHEALAFIQKLFIVGRQAKQLPPGKRGEFRRAHAAPIVEAFDLWAKEAADRCEPKGRIRAGLTYYENQREGLHRFLEDERLELDNNVSERQLRNLVQGLYNYQHFETVAGLQMYCTYRSLISSAILHRLNPHDYLEEVLRLVRHWPKERMLELAPKNWRGTVEKLDDRQRRIIKPPWKDKVPRSPLMRTG